MTFPANPVRDQIADANNGTGYRFYNGGWKVRKGILLGSSYSYDALVTSLGSGFSSSPASWASGIGGVAYTATNTPSGGDTPYTWSLDPTSAALPAGLSLNSSTGAISGTPTQAGTFNIVLRLEDKWKRRKLIPRTLTIAAPTITLASPTTLGRTGQAYSSSVAASGGVGPYVYAITSGSLPAGLTLNSSTGAITGTPTTVATSTATISATDANGFAGTLSVTWTVTLPVSFPVGTDITTFDWIADETGINMSGNAIFRTTTWNGEPNISFPGNIRSIAVTQYIVPGTYMIVGHSAVPSGSAPTGNGSVTIRRTA